MSHPKVIFYTAQLPNEGSLEWDEYEKMLAMIQGAYEKEIEKESKRLNISKNVATDVIYLRTRSRWNQEAEDELINLGKKGISVNIYKWRQKL